MQLSAPIRTAALGQLRDSSIGISAPFAQDVLIVERARIVGTSHHGDSEDVMAALELGTQLTLQRDPSNRHDEWAIRILAPSGRMLGYIPADVNEILSRLMDAGKRLFAKVRDKDESDTWIKVYVEVYLDD